MFAGNVEAGTKSKDWSKLYSGWYENRNKFNAKPKRTAKKAGRPKKAVAPAAPRAIDQAEERLIAARDAVLVIKPETPSKSYLEQFKDNIMAYLFEKENLVTGLFTSGLNDVRLIEIDGDCLRVEGRIVSCCGQGACWYLEKFTDAVRALKPEIKNVVVI